MQRRGEFSFPGSPARELLPPRPPASLTAAPRYDDEEVRWLQASRQASPDYGSGTPSPQFWAHHHNHHQQLHRPYPASAGSSPSRAQAIAGYRREMLDLVRGLPESAYELSLRDIVERPLPPATSSPSSPPPPSAAARQQHATDAAAKSDEPAAAAVAAAGGMDAAEAQVQEGTKKQSGKKQGRKQRMRKQRSRSLERSVSLDTGLLIKLFLPLSIGGKKKVSPLAKDGKKKDKEKKKKGKQGKEAAAAAAKEEDEWSKSEFSEAGGSSSRTSSTGSSSYSSAGSVRNGHVNGGVGVNPRAPARSWSRKRTGCYAFFRTNKNKSGAGQE